MTLTFPSQTLVRSFSICRRSAVLFTLATVLCAMVVCGSAGCSTSKPQRAATTSPTTQNIRSFEKFSAQIDPPADWRFEVTSTRDRHEHVTWISPGNNTAVGIIYFRLPFPVGHELAFRYGFIAEMKRKEGIANVIEKHWDPDIEGLRFVVESRYFHVEAKFFVRGMQGWAFYSGTRLRNPVNEDELTIARRVRESAEFVKSK